VTEKSVEEKIVERAERKLYLDAVVIQQGRLMQQNKKLSKDEINAMIKFGADEIFKADNVSAITDADVDAILKIGEERTKEFSNKIKSDMAHTLSSFKLETLPNDEKSIYDYEGEQFAKQTAGGDASLAMIQLPQRERKRNYNVNDYFQNALSENKSENARKRKPKSIQMYDFQFYDQERIRELFMIEFEYSEAKREKNAKIKELRNNAVRMRRRASRGDDEAAEKVETLEAEADALESTLSQHEFPKKLRDERESLIEDGFGDWNKNDFRKIVTACELYGRDKRDDIIRHVAAQIQKPQKEVGKYLDTVLTRGPSELNDWKRIDDRIQKGEDKIARIAEIEKLIKTKVKSYKNPWYSLKFDYGSSRGKSFTEDEDRWLICTVNEIGYGKWAEMRLRIRVAWQFRFDWWIKSRNSTEIQRRVDALVRIIERENKDRENGGASSRKRKR
jgi:SWI/SNF-related matrix-associated actin-dependent regulator of chromatin subfamily A member 5